MSPSRKKSRAREAIEQAKAEGKRRIHEAIDEVRAPGKKERVKGYLLAQLPYRPQSLRKGTLYQAALAEPLDFGTESVKPDSIAPRGTLPPPEHEVKARLLTPLNSATTEKNAPVEAMITQPVYSAEHKLILPEGSRILGRVTRAQPARRLHRNGQLNVVLTDIAPEMPVELANLISSAPERVEASLDSIEASRSANLALDSEGGTQVKDSKTRYLETGIAVGLAVVATNREGDHDRDAAASDSNDATRGAIGGGLGLRLVGIVTGYAARSHAFTTAMSIYGAGTSVYQHFLSRGREVVFRKDVPMEVSLAGRAPEKPEQEKAAPAPEPKE